MAQYTLVYGNGVSKVKGAGGKGVCHTSKMQATHAGNIVSAKYYTATGTATAANTIENGHVVKITELISGEYEMYEAVPVETAGETALLVATPELMYDESTKAMGIDDFENAAGAPIRLFNLYVGDEFEISKNCVNDYTAVTTWVGAYIAPSATVATKWEKITAGVTAIVSYETVARVIAEKTWGVRGVEMVAVRVVKAR